jgi:hypothetical protein
VPETLFIATERFDPSDGEKWTRFSRWAKIPALREVISLDIMLCPRLIKSSEFIPEDWGHVVNVDYRLDYFYDLPYLLGRISNTPRRNVLGLYRNPLEYVESPPGPGAFHFAGYDLIEEATQISALVNCGGFPDVFANQELNCYGLLTEFIRARDIQRLLRDGHPAEHHANCELYGIWRLQEGLSPASA